MSAIDLKTMKHRAESILESENKQFVSKTEKDKWNNCQGGSGNVDLTDYYTKSQVNAEISKVKALMAGVKFLIAINEWTANNGTFKYTLQHDFDLPLESTSLTFFNANNEHIELDWKYVNSNTVEVYSNVAIISTLVIKHIVETQTRSVDLSNYYTKPETNDLLDDKSNKIHKHNYSELEGTPPAVDLSNYYNKAQTETKIEEGIDRIVGAAPDALDTLKELGDALGNDANFSTTITNLIAEKATKKEVGDLFQYVSNGKNSLEAVITDKGGVVSKLGQVATFNELRLGIISILIEDLIGKQNVVNALNNKFDIGLDAENITLSEIAVYILNLDLEGLLFKKHYSVLSKVVKVNRLPGKSIDIVNINMPSNIDNGSPFENIKNVISNKVKVSNKSIDTISVVLY